MIKEFLYWFLLFLFLICILFVFPYYISHYDSGDFNILNTYERNRNGLLYICFYFMSIILLSLFFFKKHKFVFFLIVFLNLPTLSKKFYYFCGDSGDRFLLESHMEKVDYNTIRYNLLSSYFFSGISLFKKHGYCRQETIIFDMKMNKVVGENYSLGSLKNANKTKLGRRQFKSFLFSTFIVFCCSCWLILYSKK